MIEAFPLSWPIGRPRTPVYRLKRATFSTNHRALSTYDSLLRLRREIELLGAANLVVSSNVPTRRDGDPRAGFEPTDPGVAIYFQIVTERPVAMQQTCLACDRWDRVADNIAAIAAHVGATRGILRWGVGDVAQAFAGYRQLAAVGADRPWWQVLGFDKPPPAEGDVRDRWLQRAAENHPDRGGTHDASAELNRAYSEAKSYYLAR